VDYTSAKVKLLL